MERTRTQETHDSENPAFGKSEKMNNQLEILLKRWWNSVEYYPDDDGDFFHKSRHRSKSALQQFRHNYSAYRDIQSSRSP